tara:strand:+ start:247 stop:663 length:417 start_codon:yes stop_codon:yes gene_type:complete
MNNPLIDKNSFKFHHIGSLTSNIDEAEKAFCKLGFIFSKRVDDPIQEVKLSFGKNNLGIQIELVKPYKNSKIENILKRNGPGPYHICFEVNSISREEKKLYKSGFICVKKPEKAIALQNRFVAFYFNPIYGLLELLEK